ncbi:7126_t:CDS:2 [Rhizophagus irregularis]|nr:7126_t:CDS:2 [Rhizophagus irregularis]
MDTPTEQQKKKDGRSQRKVWRHYEKKPLKSDGHFLAKCNYCRTYWPHGHSNKLKDHLANNCKEVSELVHSFYLDVVSAQNFGREDTFSSPENSKKRKTQKTITTTAAQIWQNNGGDKKSCNRLLAQIRNYELQKSPYNQEIDSHFKTPISWWLKIKDKYDYLPALAIIVFSITSHSTGCERIFSTLGWLYGT